jgi:ribosomal protein S18 acetylase RimI-like enzyme
MTVREFRIEDYEQLIELWQEAHLPYKPKGRDSKEEIERELRGHNAVFLVAEENGRLVGSIFGTHDGRKGWINRVATAPAYQKQGIARTLVREVERRLRNMGIKIIACLIEDWNTGSVAFFEKMGYVRYQHVLYFTKREGPDT